MRSRVLSVIQRNIENSIGTSFSPKDKQFLGYLAILFVLLLAISFSLKIKSAKEKEKDPEEYLFIDTIANDANSQNVL